MNFGRVYTSEVYNLATIRTLLCAVVLEQYFSTLWLHYHTQITIALYCDRQYIKHLISHITTLFLVVRATDG